MPPLYPTISMADFMPPMPNFAVTAALSAMRSSWSFRALSMSRATLAS